MNSLPSVSVIIPAHNEEEYIERTLLALHNSDYPKDLLDIMVVDNNSSDRTHAIASEYADKTLLLREGNVGAVRNLGAKNSLAKVLIFLDADCLIDDGWISRGVALLWENNNVFGGPYKVRNNANWVERLWLLENTKYPRLQPDLLGGCIFIRSETFASVGGFNEDMTSGEDSDLSARLRKSGYSVNIVPDLAVIHLGNPQTIKKFFTRQIWHSENYLPFIRKSVKDYTFWMIIFFTISAALCVIASLSSNLHLAAFSLSMMLGLSAALSVKRLLLTRFVPKSLQDILGIVLLDFIYLSARSLGAMKPLFRGRN